MGTRAQPTAGLRPAHQKPAGGRRSSRIPALLLALMALSACGGGASQPASTVQVTPAETARPALSPEDARDALARGIGALQAGDTTAARIELERVGDDPESGALAAYHLGMAAHMEGNGALAIRHYEHALELDPTLAAALVATIRLRLEAGDRDGAQIAYQRALGAGQNAPALRAAGLRIGLARGDYEGVIRDARDILLYEEGNIDAQLALAEAYYRLDQGELSKLVLREALTRAPERVDLYLLLSAIQIDEGNDVGAIQTLRQLLEIDDRFVEAHNNLGVLLHRARNEEEAIEHLQRAVELRPDFARAWLNLSNALKGDGQLREAEAAIQAALQVDPTLAQAHFNLGLLYLDTDFPGMTRQERFQAAADALNRYRSAMGASLPPDSRVEEYINEALAALQAERELEAMGGGEGGEDGDDGFSDDFSDGEDEWEDVEWEDE